MESPNPYRTPTADIHPPAEGGSDLTPPYSPAGRFGRLSYIAWLMIVSVAVPAYFDFMERAGQAGM